MSMEIISNLCRICVSESYFYSNIYDQNEMETSRIFEAINDVCQLDISEDDGLPQYICAQCERKLSEFRLFKKQSHKSKMILYSMKDKKRKVSQVEHSAKPKLEEDDDTGIVVEDYETPQKQALYCAEDRVESILPNAKEVDNVDQVPNEVFIKIEPKEDEVLSEDPVYDSSLETYDDDRLGNSSSTAQNVVSDARGPPEEYFLRRPGGFRRPAPQKFGVSSEIPEEITNSSEVSGTGVKSALLKLPGKKEKNCCVCSGRANSDTGKRKRARTMCSRCEKGLHGICFPDHKCTGSIHARRSSADPQLGRLLERHFPDVIPATEKKEKPTRKCIACSKIRDSQGKIKRKETRYMCPDCDVALCITPCFKIYHTEWNM